MEHDAFEFTAATIATPFHSSGEAYYEYEYAEEQWEEGDYLPQEAVQQRIVVLIVALVVIIPLTVLFLSRLGADNAVVSRPVAPVAAAAASEPVSPAPGVGGGSALGQLSPVFTPEVRYWEAQILNWSAQYDLDPNLTAIIMQVESCGHPNAVSSAGAQGLFQVMPFHFSNGENMQDPDTNARRGLNYFTEGLRLTSGNIGLSFAGYNGGHGTAARSQNQWPNETQRYYQWTTGIYNDIQAGLTDSPTLQTWLQAGGAALCRQAASRLGLTG